MRIVGSLNFISRSLSRLDNKETTNILDVKFDTPTCKTVDDMLCPS